MLVVFLFALLVSATANVFAGSAYTVKSMSASFSTTCAILNNDGTKCFGKNTHFGYSEASNEFLGDEPNEMGNKLFPIDFGTGLTAKSISAGPNHVCAILSDDSLKCYGGNAYGQLGYGNTLNNGNENGDMGDAIPRVNVGKGLKALQVGLGWDFTCARLNDSSVKCWGSNDYGNLGRNNLDIIGDDTYEMGNNLSSIYIGTTVKAIAVGSGHVCAITAADAVKCWGSNSNGQLGQEHMDNIGDDPNEMQSLAVIALGTGFTAKKVAAGGYHTCVLLNDDTLKCFGGNGAGQLGIGNGNDVGSSSGSMGNFLAKASLGTGVTITAVGCGDFHTCVILTNSSVKCFGDNAYGNLGIPNDTLALGDEASEVGNNLPIVSLGTGRTAKAIAVGYTHTCVVLDTDDAKCFGDGSSGALGQGSNANIGDLANQMGDALPAIDFGGPTTSPTRNPTRKPSTNPSKNPSRNPTKVPSKNPSRNPTPATKSPSKNPSRNPSKNPSKNPTPATQNPTNNPTSFPSFNPSKNPSQPSNSPTRNPVKDTQPTVECRKPDRSPTECNTIPGCRFVRSTSPQFRNLRKKYMDLCISLGDFGCRSVNDCSFKCKLLAKRDGYCGRKN